MSTTDDNDEQCNGGSEEITSSKKERTSCEQNNIDNITEGIDSVSTPDSVAILNDMSTCASCGKEGKSDDMNTCNKCKMVKYCNAACKKKHRKKHKKACERRVAELHDEQLFKEVEPEECPICLIPMPINGEDTSVNPCCGKRICNGCKHTMKMSEGKDELCAFCRTPFASSGEEIIKRTKKLMDKGNGEGCLLFASYYARGMCGMPQDWVKCNELLLKAGELGCASGYYNLAESYNRGAGAEIDKNKAKHYWELAAMNGSIRARIDLGYLELEADNYDQALKHWIIAAKAGHEPSLDNVTKVFKGGLISKDEYANTLRAYQQRRNESASEQRDKAAVYYASR